jgi:transcriptional regulator with XRE-family HTH domain
MTAFEKDVEKRFQALSRSVSRALTDAKGDATFADLAATTGKAASTMSGHLKPGANLTLRTLAQYEAALGTEVIGVVVGQPKAPSGRRRRARPEGGWTAEREAKTTDPATMRLHRLLTRLSQRIAQLLAARGDLDQQTLAARAQMQPAHLSRLLGGGVNPTLRTLVALEVALGASLLRVEGTASRPELARGRHVEGHHETPTEMLPLPSQLSYDEGCVHDPVRSKACLTVPLSIALHLSTSNAAVDTDEETVMAA